MQINIAVTQLLWWTVLVVNVLGYFIFRFGMISHGAKKSQIEFAGGTILLGTFLWMFLQFGWKSGLLLILIFTVFITPIVEIVIRKISKKLYGEINNVIENRMVGMGEEKIGSENIVEKLAEADGLRTTISREELKEVARKANDV